MLHGRMLGSPQTLGHTRVFFMFKETKPKGLFNSGFPETYFHVVPASFCFFSRDHYYSLHLPLFSVSPCFISELLGSRLCLRPYLAPRVLSGKVHMHINCCRSKVTLTRRYEDRLAKKVTWLAELGGINFAIVEQDRMCPSLYGGWWLPESGKEKMKGKWPWNLGPRADRYV